MADDPPGAVTLLGDRIQRGLVAEELPVDAKPVHPHVTLARARGRRGVLPPDLVGDLPRVEAGWIAREVAVVRSHLGGGPVRYEVLARVPLAL